jgi:Mn-dependent DtxR family transcriptional regulator
MKGTGVGRIAEVLDVDSGSITKAMRHLIDVGLLEKKDNGFYYPSQKWYIAHDGE